MGPTRQTARRGDYGQVAAPERHLEGTDAAPVSAISPYVLSFLIHSDYLHGASVWYEALLEPLHRAFGSVPPALGPEQLARRAVGL